MATLGGGAWAGAALRPRRMAGYAWGMPSDDPGSIADATLARRVCRFEADDEEADELLSAGHPLRTFGAAKTVSVWYRATVDPGQPPSPSATLFDTADTMNDFVVWDILDDGDIRVLYRQNGSRNKEKRFTGAGTAVRDGTWHLLVLVQDSFGTVNGGNPITDARFDAGIRLYTDGFERTVFTTAHGNNIRGEGNPNARLFVGGSDLTPASHAHGRLDEMMTYSEAKPKSFIDELYGNGTLPPYTESRFAANRVNYWQLGEGDVFPIITDEEGNDDLTMNPVMSQANFVIDAV